MEGNGEQNTLTKAKPQPQPELDEALERLTKRIAKGGGITLAGSGFGRVVQFGFYILLGRVLGASGYGLYALGFSIIQLASQFSFLGLPTGIVRFVAIYKGEEDLRRVKGTLISGFSIAIVASIPVGTLLFIFSRFISLRIFNDPQLASVLQVFAIVLPFFVVMQMAAQAIRGFQRMGYYAVINLIRPVANVLLVGLAFLLGYRLMGAVYAFLASVALTGGISLFLLTKRIFIQSAILEPIYEVKRLFRFSLPVIFIGFSQFILSQIDRLMIGYFMTSADVGIYSAASRIAIQTSFIITAFNTAFAPMIADLYNQQRIGELDGLFKLVTRWIVMMTLPLVLSMVLFPAPVIGMFGAGFVRGAGVLIVLALAYFVNAATGSVGFMLIMSGKQDIELVNTLSMGAINIGLNIWLIQIYGILGAAVATGLSIAIVNIIRLIEVRKLIGIQPYTRKYLKPLSGSLLVVLLLKAVPGWSGIDLHWAFGLALCPLLYIGFMIMLGLEREDRMVLRAVRRKLASII